MILSMALFFSSFVYADNWDSAYLDSQECRYPYCRCIYTVGGSGGFKFNITVRKSFCSSIIYVDLERGVWKD
ncbi:hypothetical protein A6A20_04145 [Volucribacter amazonae]|uniref:Uncharacterized protein n=2 Tax=Volucribacter amazonae TaxID=256731 RepID=A0A9X4PBX2_9PAST|nr:hypothetical protein [Volucribacter amazonae]